MRVLITGVTGFVGARLVDALRARGHVPVGLSRGPEGVLDRIPALEAIHAWSPLEGPPPPAAFEGVDAVVNLLGESVAGRWTRSKKRAIRESRVTGTRNLVAGIERADPRPPALVSASAVGYYGDRGDERLTEASAPGVDFLATVCRDWELEAAAAIQLGARVVPLRIGLVLAPGGGTLDVMLPLFRLGLGGILGSGRQWWPWIHRDDLVGMIVWAIESDEVAGAINACAPEPARQREFARILGRVLGRPTLVPAPGFVLRLALGEFSREILAGRRVVPTRALELGYTFGFRTIEKALRNLLGTPPG